MHAQYVGMQVKYAYAYACHLRSVHLSFVEEYFAAAIRHDRAQSTQLIGAFESIIFCNVEELQGGSRQHTFHVYISWQKFSGSQPG